MFASLIRRITPSADAATYSMSARRTVFTPIIDNNLNRLKERVASNPKSLRHRTKAGNTPLHVIAAYKKRNGCEPSPQLIEFVLTKIGYIDLMNNVGATALNVACHTQSSYTVKRLLMFGADPMHCHQTVLPPLAEAIKTAHLLTYREILAETPLSTGKNRRTDEELYNLPLKVAQETERMRNEILDKSTHFQIGDDLLEASANINQVSWQNETALSHLIHSYKGDSIQQLYRKTQWLLQHGASVIANGIDLLEYCENHEELSLLVPLLERYHSYSSGFSL